jgi:PAS domain-containing protein
MMEADDCIAAFCQLYADPTHEINIVSGDKDFTQLLKLPNVKLINPDNGKARNQPGDKDYEEDIDYWLFKKFIRGDGGDNVPSAFPRVRETRIKKAYEHEYDRLNFMNEHWTQSVFEADENGIEVEKKIVHRVGDLYEENIILMDLYRQPDEVQHFARVADRERLTYSLLISSIGEAVIVINTDGVITVSNIVMLIR